LGLDGRVAGVELGEALAASLSKAQRRVALGQSKRFGDVGHDPQPRQAACEQCGGGSGHAQHVDDHCGVGGGSLREELHVESHGLIMAFR